MTLQIRVLLVLILGLIFCGTACKSQSELCKQEARYKCFGESLEGKPQKFIGNKPVGCKASIYEHCMAREGNPTPP